MAYKDIFVVVVLLCTGISMSCAQNNKYALIIGLSNYPAESGWLPINGGNDIEILKGTLQKRGFKKKNIIAIGDANATASGIRRAVGQLERRVKRGSFVVVSYSGHGQQMYDDNQDELDGKDESLAPYDSKPVQGAYQGSAHLRDDDLFQLLQPLRRKLGPEGQLLVLADACHSGTVSRNLADSISNAPVRGTAKVFGAPREGLKPTDIEETFMDIGLDDKGLAPQFTISATRPNELNREYKENGTFYGPLSLAFSKVFVNLSLDATYEELFDLLASRMMQYSSEQHPVLEGDPNIQVGANSLSPPVQHFTIEEVISGKEVRIDGGWLFNLYKGTTLIFYPVGTTPADTAEVEPVAKGRIERAEFGSAEVIITTPPVPEEKLSKAWGYIEQRNYGPLRLDISLNVQNAQLLNDLRDRIESFKALRLTEENADAVVHQEHDQVYVESNGQVCLDLPLIGIQVDSIIDQLFDLARVRFLSRLDLKDAEYDVGIEIIPVDLEFDQEGFAVESKTKYRLPKFNSSGQVLLNTGEHFEARFFNNGDKDAYFAILEIYPEGDIEVLLPKAGQGTSTLLEANSPPDLSGFYRRADSTSTTLNWLIVGADAPLENLNKLNQRTAASRKPLHPFEQLYLGTQADSPSQNRDSNTTPNVLPRRINLRLLSIEITE